MVQFAPDKGTTFALPRTMKAALSPRRFVGPWFASLAFAGALHGADESAAVAGRLTAVFEGITCEYSPGQEEIARLLATRIADRNREAAAAAPAPLPLPDATVPLSPAEMRANRAQYLAAICAQLALKKPTAFQEECYDAFLNNYESTMRMFHLLGRATMAGTARLDKITLWDRAELVGRLQAGEKVTGFIYDPVTKQGSVAFKLPEMEFKDDRLKELTAQREQLKNEYLFKITAAEGGGSNYHGGVSKRRQAPPADPAPPKAAEPQGLQFFPIVIPAQLSGLPPAELAAQLWEGSTKGGVQQIFDGIGEMVQSLPTVDPAIAHLVLHETTEIGVVDHYYRGRDRRWFCDGVANYVSWRVVRDRHGPAAAQHVYDLPAQLARYADLRDQADLRKWAATENQSEAEQESRLNRARYAYATQAIMLMGERAGPDALRKLFAEIGRTKREKVSFDTVQKAWRKIAGTDLDALLAEVAKPGPAPKAN